MEKLVIPDGTFPDGPRDAKPERPASALELENRVLRFAVVAALEILEDGSTFDESDAINAAAKILSNAKAEMGK